MKEKAHKPRPAGRRLKWQVRLLLVVALSMGTVLWADYAIRPLVEEVGAHHLKILAVEQINAAVLEQLEQLTVDQQQMITVRRSPEGLVTSVETDVVQVNLLKMRLIQAVQKQLNSPQASVKEFSIPIGSFTKSPMLLNKGPGLTFQLGPVSFTEGEITSQFDSAGINQTRHRLMLSLTAEVTAVLGGCQVHETAHTDVCIGETIIVGEVPDAFFRYSAQDSDFEGKED